MSKYIPVMCWSKRATDVEFVVTKYDENAMCACQCTCVSTCVIQRSVTIPSVKYVYSKLWTWIACVAFLSPSIEAKTSLLRVNVYNWFFGGGGIYLERTLCYGVWWGLEPLVYVRMSFNHQSSLFRYIVRWQLYHDISLWEHVER